MVATTKGNASSAGNDHGTNDTTPESIEGPVRMYIGGLAADVTAAELRERFGRIAAASQCQLTDIELPPSRLCPSQSKGFAYMTIDGETAARVVEEIAKAYHRTKWRGGVLRVEIAKPDYQQRLQSEWDVVEEKLRVAAEAVDKERRRLLPAQGEVEEMVTGVEFQGTKRTTFEYEEEVEEDVVMEDMGGEEEQATDAESDAVEEASDEEEQAEEMEEEEDSDVVVDAAPSSSEDEEEEEEEEEVEDDSEEENDDGASSDASSVSSLSSPLSAVKKSSSSAPVESVEDVNARRLAALEEKKKKQQQAAAVTKGLLGKINAVGGASGKKITFDDDGEVAEIEDARELGSEAERNSGGAPAKKVVVDWMNSDDEEEEELQRRPESYGELDDDAKLALSLQTGKPKPLKTLEFDFDDAQGGGEEDATAEEEDTEDAQRFALRPEFLGETGKKLFEMQKRFGGDQRFRMDARFIEEEENEYFAVDGDDLAEDPEQTVVSSVGGEETSGEEWMLRFRDEEDASKLAMYAEEMTRERDQALDVIAELFPDVDVDQIRYRLEALTRKDPIKEASWMGAQMRYDPRVSATLRYELSMEDAGGSGKRQKEREEVDAEEEQRLAEEKKKREEKEVLVGGDRFYSASTSLSNLFTRVRKNSEDGEVGEAALDGVFSWGSSTAAIGAVAEGSNKGSESSAAPASAFKLSSLFSFGGGGEEDKAALAMGEDLLEAEDEEDAEDKPWQFSQSLAREDESMPLGEMHDDTDKEEDEEEEEEEEETKDAKRKTKRVRVTRSLDDFLAFGRSFVSPEAAADENEGGEDKSGGAEAEAERKKQWADRRKKLTQDFKRKRRDALKHKKKQQQAQRQHHAKRQKMSGGK